MASGEIATAPDHSFAHTISFLRLGEFDLGGVLYHAHYYHLYEEIREAFLRSIGLPYPLLVSDFHHLAINESHQNFLAPVFYGEELSGKLWTSEVRNSSFVFHYELSTARGLVHYGWTRHVYVKTGDGFRVERLPDRLKDALSRYLAEREQ